MIIIFQLRITDIYMITEKLLNAIFRLIKSVKQYEMTLILSY